MFVVFISIFDRLFYQTNYAKNSSLHRINWLFRNTSRSIMYPSTSCFFYFSVWDSKLTLLTAVNASDKNILHHDFVCLFFSLKTHRQHPPNFRPTSQLKSHKNDGLLKGTWFLQCCVTGITRKDNYHIFYAAAGALWCYSWKWVKFTSYLFR